MLKEFQLGIGSYFEAHAFIRKHKMWLFVLLPGLLNLIVISILVATTWHYTEFYTLKLTNWVGLDNTDWGWFDGLADVIYYFMLIIFRLAIMAVYFKFYKYIVLILMAPFIAYISERTEELLTGKTYPFDWRVFLNNIFRGIGLAVKNIVIEIALTIFILSFSFVPLLAFVIPFLLLLVESYFYGFSMIDYYSERKNLSVREGSRFVWRHKILAITNGSLFVALLLLPVIGILIGPTYSVIAATIATNKLYSENGES